MDITSPLPSPAATEFHRQYYDQKFHKYCDPQYYHHAYPEFANNQISFFSFMLESDIMIPASIGSIFDFIFHAIDMNHLVH